MNAAIPSPILRAHVDADGALLSADPPILQLQEEAGAQLGEALAVPQLAGIARLAARLGIAISRPAIAAGKGRSIEMWVRARAVDGAVQLSIVDWQEQPSAQGGSNPDRDADLAALAPGWTWQIDTRMRFEMVLDGPANGPDAGTPFSAYFTLLPDEEGDMPILSGFAQRRAFAGQKAALAGQAAVVMQLSGFPLFDMSGRLMGYRGKAGAVEVPAADGASIDAEPADFGKRLDESLRRPLGRIIANADTISAQMEGPLRPDYAGYAHDIATAGRHLLALVDDLADLQAIDRPDFAVVSEDVDLADVARRAAGLLGVKALDKAIRIDAPHADERAPATGEFRRVLQILVNLIGNAVRYAPAESQVWVRVDRGAGVTTVVVADQGPGIAPEDQARMFEKFERLGREDSVGSGLGLYISRRLARAMGGDIIVESALGQGARFMLSLPVGDDSGS